MKKKYYWKIVSKTSMTSNGIYGSYLIGAGPYQCLYNVNDWTTSKINGNGLFVFKTRKNARNWKRKNNPNNQRDNTSLIFKVEVGGKEITDTKKYNFIQLILGILKLSESTSVFPRGTAIFEKVRLVSKQ